MLSLQELSKQWASAVGSLRALKKVINEVLQQTNLEGTVPTVSLETAPFFEDFGPALCKQWSLVAVQREGNELGEPISDHQALSANYPAASASFLPDLRGVAATNTSPGILESSCPSQALDGWGPDLNLLEGSWEGSGFDWSGSWLLNDWIG